MNNIFVLNKSYRKIGTLSNQGANPQAPYFNDLYVQELETGADTYQFSTLSNKYTQDFLEIGNHIMFAYKNRNELFTITSIEYSHNEGYKTVGVYAEGIGFDLLEVFMERPKTSSSSGGNDSDGDGDDNTDDEYADPDDVYIDANGNIIYDKDGSGSSSAEDVTIDGDGNIIYRPSKNNKKNDSLEFKNISYPRFLSILLKNSGWSYVCQPGLESVKHDITVKYDTNIYAILQDSMQSYRGVELEFVHELVGGRVQKVIKAYKDGGRGSFVGKRFEYGKNVKGITKTQEVANSEDDTILYVDNVGIDVRYDVDFALKSAEVSEIEIGDTHYVIDNDFCPPMQIKARIGKIEISFSDPTVNKIYLANNKRISGSAIEDEFNEDDIKDIIDDYDIGDGGEYVPYHKHDSLHDFNYNSCSVMISGKVFHGTTSNYFDLGSRTFPWYALYTNAVFNSNYIESPRYVGYNYQVLYDRDDMEDVTKITDSSEITKQDLLNFIINDLNVYEYSATEVNEAVNKDVDDPDAYFSNQIYFGILSEDVVDHGNPCKTTSKVGARIGRGLIQGDTNNDGDQNNDDTHNAHTYNIPALLSCLIGAFQQHVAGGTTSDPSDPGSGDSSEYITKDYADETYASKAEFEVVESEHMQLMVLEPVIRDLIELEPDIRDLIENGSGDLSEYITEEELINYNYANKDYVDEAIAEAQLGEDVDINNIVCDTLSAKTVLSSPNINSQTASLYNIENVVSIRFHDGTRMNSAPNCSDTETLGGRIELEVYTNEWDEPDVRVNINETTEVKGNFRVYHDPSKYYQTGWIYADTGVSTFNFTANQGHFDIVDVDELTIKGVPINPAALAATASAELSEYATVEALQEEIRAKDEQIANLEARLATIEAMLGINNDN